MRSPFIAQQPGVNLIMYKVLAALLPAFAVYYYYFGPAILISMALATLTALAAETVMLNARKFPLKPFLSDGSAVLTAWLLALSIPPIAPWWMVVVGTLFGMVVAKHLYGGLGQNLFNPAMAGFAVLMVSFPAHMTHWPAPFMLAEHSASLGDVLSYYFSGTLPGGVKLDAVTMATPLDTLKTQLQLEKTVETIQQMPIFGQFGGKGGEVVAAMYLLGGLFLLQQRIITWHVPVTFLVTLATIAAVFHGIDAHRYASPMFHLATGGAMLGAFFIATDYVTGPTTALGKMIFGVGVGLLEYIIRVFGGYPDGIAFSVLIMNACVPMIDTYTQARVYGHAPKSKQGA